MRLSLSLFTVRMKTWKKLPRKEPQSSSSPVSRLRRLGTTVRSIAMAVAHTMLTIAYTMPKTGRSYHELGGNYLEHINRDQLQPYLVKRLQKLGLTVTVAPAA